MAHIRAFRGWRYDASRIGNLARVMAPPYDAIDATLAPRLARRHPQNAVRLIWTGDSTRPAPVRGAVRGPTWAGASKRGPYEDAARALRDWIADGTLLQEERPALYGYAQTYRDPDGEERTQLGFMAAVELAAYGHGIHPHERTHAPFVEDRVELLRATRAHVSPIFGLYSDPEHRISGILAGSPRVDAVGWTDAEKVAHALWVVDDPRLVQVVIEAMSSRDIVIADGHHRYEAALSYQRERRATPGGGGGAAASSAAGDDHVLMFLTAMEDRGSMVLPIHRLIAGVGPVDIARLVAVLERGAHVETVTDLDQAMAVVGVERLAAPATPAMPATPATPATPAPPATAATAAIPATSDGDVSHVIRFALLTREGARLITVPVAAETTAAEVCRELVLENGLGWDAEEAARDGRLTYVNGWREAASRVLSGHHACACLLPATPVAQIVATARAGRTMPAKSTYFHPKVPTGPVLQVLDGD